MPDHPQMNELADEHGMDLHYGREAMPEHVHEWDVSWLMKHADNAFHNPVRCECDERIDWNEIVRRLNATEKLSAEDAIALDDYADHPDPAIKGNGYAYASALKGKAPTP